VQFLEVAHMRLTVTARTQLDPALRTYAVEKLERLGRHDGRIHEARAVLEEDDRRVPRASAEVLVHLHHTRVKARCDGASLREAIDKVVDKVDRQILDHKERIKEHKGRPAAGSDPLAPAPRHVVTGAAIAAVATPVAADPVAARRSVLLRPMSLVDAVAAYEDGAEPFLLFLDEDGGEVCLLSRREDGEVELVVGDTR
jgi:putative sigma-54 modulation protein